MTDRRRFLTGLAALGALPGAATAAEAFQLDPQFAPQIVNVKEKFVQGEIHVIPAAHFLYHMMGNGQAVRYGVAVGAEGLNMKGEAHIGRKVEWPSWTPTKAMIRREPEKYAKYAGGMKGGPDNPLGARALYLYRNGRDTFYRIHGTPQPWSIGQSVSSGCIRMINEHVIALYDKVPIGTRVVLYD